MYWTIMAIIVACVLLEGAMVVCLLFCYKQIPNPFDFEYRCKIKYLGNNVKELIQNQEYIIDVCRDNAVDTMIQCRIWIKDNKDRYSDIILFYNDYSSFIADWDFTIEYSELRKWGST